MDDGIVWGQERDIQGLRVVLVIGSAQQDSECSLQVIMTDQTLVTHAFSSVCIGRGWFRYRISAAFSLISPNC